MISEDSIRSRPPAGFIHFLTLLGIILACGAVRIAEYDIWWHIKAGEIITKWRMIPHYDIFSYTAAGRPWLYHEWLFQVVAAYIYRIGGVIALQGMVLAVVAMLTFICYRTIELFARSRSLALLGSCVILMGIADRIFPRPDLFTLLFTAIFILECHRYSVGLRKNLWTLPVLQLIWMNMHGGGLTGPQILLAFAIGETIQTKFFRPSLDGLSEGYGPIEGSRTGHLWLIAIISLGACALTPMGMRAFTFPFELSKMTAILNYTQEWLPVLDARLDGFTTQIIFRCIFILAFASFILNRKHARLSHLLLLAMACIFIMRGRRFTQNFCVISIPIILYNLRFIIFRVSISERFRTAIPWISCAIVAAISIIYFVFGIPLTIRGDFKNSVGFGAEINFAPEPLIQFLDRNNIHGRVFNEMGAGGYLMLRRWPRDLVFIDGRTPIYGDDFYRRYIEAFRKAENFEKLDGEYHFDYMVFKADQAWNLKHMHKYLWEGKRWKLVYFTNAGLIYVRNTPQFRDVIEKFEIKENPLIVEMNKEVASSTAD